jgi:hypothetical protein
MYVQVKCRALLLRLSENLSGLKITNVLKLENLVGVYNQKNLAESPITVLPSDLLYNILSYVKYKRWFQLCYLNRRMNINLRSNEQFWKGRWREVGLRRRCFYLSNFEEVVRMEKSKRLAKHCWEKIYRYSSWVREIKHSLNGPATAEDIVNFENSLGILLPYQILSSIRIHDGQFCKKVAVIDNISLHSIEEIFTHYKQLSVKNRLRFKYKLPVGAGTSLGDQSFIYIDLEKADHAVYLSSPHGNTDCKICPNWFSFLLSIGQ